MAAYSHGLVTTKGIKELIKSIQGLDVAAKIQATLGEGPAWNTKLGVLHCVDIFGKRVYTHNPELGTIDHFSTEMFPGAVLPTTANKLAIALDDGLYLADLDGKNLEKKFSIEPEILGNRMNDAKCDPNGVLFGGTMGDGNSPTGSLYRIDSHGITKVLKDVTVSNGLAWNPDGSKMYYIDSGKKSVQVSDFDASTSSIIGFKNFIEFPDSFGIPDGMCADREGGIWVAFFGGQQVRRFSAEGIQTHEIQLPVPQITSCCFAGEDSTTLYITTASIDLGDGRKIGIEDGNLFLIDVGIPGAGTVPFVL
jgi:sugar lactone lactonase YvrE